MSWLFSTNLIALFDLYLIVIFILGIVLRYRQYRSVIAFVRKVPDRWPNLYEVMKEEKRLFLNWSTLLPVLGVLAIMVVHAGLYRFVWASADVSVQTLQQHWPYLVWIVLCGLGMIAIDLYMVFTKSKQDLGAAEEKLEQAEFWLKSKWSTAVKVMTFGMVKPRKQVRTELKKAISGAVKAMDRMLWQWGLQIGMRYLFGFSLWFTWVTVLR